MKCEKCQDRGFTEENHGLVMVPCDCDAAQAAAESLGIPWKKAEEVVNDNSSDNRTGQPDTNIGSTDTSEPKQPKKQRAKKKARKRTS